MGRRKKNTEVEADVEEVKVSEAVLKGVYVASGKAIVCRRGILPEGTEVFAKDFPGGDATIEEHIVNGGLVKR